MKVFLAHKETDQELALRVARRLRTQHKIGCLQYVIDGDAEARGETFAQRVAEEMGTCTHVLAVVSPGSHRAPWVLWQAGLASGRELPMTIFCEGEQPTEFLERWPHLQSMDDLDKFGEACKAAETTYESYRHVVTGSAARAEAVREFYDQLRGALRGIADGASGMA